MGNIIISADIYQHTDASVELYSLHTGIRYDIG